MPRPSASAIGLIVGLVCVASSAHAQNTEGEFSVQRFEPVPGPRNYMSVAGGRTDGNLDWSAGMLFDYMRDPFVIVSCVSATDCDDPEATNRENVSVVQDVATWNVLGSFTPIPRLQIGLRVPVVYASGEGVNFDTGGASTEGLQGAAMGDITLEGKVRIFGEPQDIFVLAAAADIAAPVGHAIAENTYIGNDTPVTVGARAIADLKVDGFSAAAHLRGIWREDARFGDTTIGPEFRWGVGAGYQFHELFRAIAETYGATRFSMRNGTNSLEVDAGMQIMPLDGRLLITLAGGTGVVRGLGVPVGRVIAGLTFVSETVPDDDDDDVANDRDKCVDQAEDRDGVADDDGCPEEDFDKDKIDDAGDRCPTEPETENGYKDEDGCPDKSTDTDRDGILDDRDNCPKHAGKMTSKGNYGCPDVDEDGVPDAKDRCSGEAEDTDGFQDTDGCPDPDNDDDGVTDQYDECDGKKEDMNGVDDTDGCPDE